MWSKAQVIPVDGQNMRERLKCAVLMSHLSGLMMNPSLTRKPDFTIFCLKWERRLGEETTFQIMVQVYLKPTWWNLQLFVRDIGII